MFRRASAEKNAPLKSVMVRVDAYVNGDGNPEGPKNTVMGTRFDNGERVAIGLTTSGEAADNAKRNSVESFSKKSSKHHVEVGGLIQFDTVWMGDEELDGAKRGIARWASFFEKNAPAVENNISSGNVMFHAGVSARPNGDEVRWAYVERLGKPMGVELAQLEDILGKLAANAESAGARARPTLRVMDAQGQVMEFAGVAQRDIKGEDGKYRPQTAAEMMADLQKSKAFQNVAKLIEQGAGTLEMIPSRSFKVSPKTMEGNRGKAFVGLNKVFNNDEQSFAQQAWVRTVKSEESGAIFVSNLGLIDHKRIEPLLLPSDKHPNPVYHGDLMASLSHGKQHDGAPQAPAPTEADHQAPAAATSEPEPDYDDAPDFV